MRAWLEAAVARHPRRVQRIIAATIAVVGVAIAWAFAATVLRHTRPMALPLDDSYGYLDWARQLGRGRLVAASEAPGGLWPLVLAPLWTLGARGHALVWAAFVVSAALYVAAALGVFRIVRQIAGDLAGVLAAMLLLGVAPFAWSALAGTEAALASALLVAVAGWLIDAPRTGPPAIRLALALGAAMLVGRVPAVLAIAIAIVAAVQRARRRELRAALWWLAPLVVAAAWWALDRGRGPWLASDAPGGGVRVAELGRMLRAVFWDATSPLVWPRLVALLWLVGAVRVIGWARRADHGPAAALIVVAPAVVMLAALASPSGWSADHGRYLAPAFPFVMIGVGCALGPLRRVRDPRAATIAGVARRAGSLAGLAGFAWFAIPGVVADARRFAQAAADLNAGLGAVADHVQRKPPGGRVMAEQRGRLAYVADVAVDALPARHGPGALFEQLERLALDLRPTRFVLDPAGPSAAVIAELSGDSAFRTAPRPRFAPRSGVAPASVEVRVARWDHVGTCERPLLDHTGWAIVDRIDLADLESEAAHAWTGALGPAAGPARAALGSPVSLLGREVGVHGLLLDGGRTVRGGHERFAIAIDPARPVRLVLRTGGARSVPGHDPPGQAVDRPIPLRLLDDAGRELARATLPAPDGRFAEVSFALPAGTSRVLRTEASLPYRAFHWFVLQPE